MSFWQSIYVLALSGYLKRVAGQYPHAASAHAFAKEVADNALRDLK